MGKMYDGEIYEKVSQWFDGHREEMTEDIKRLVRIPSISDPEAEQGPFGQGCRDALDEMLAMGRKYGFHTENREYYVGSIGVENQDWSNTIGLWNHLDVVPLGEGWDYEPFEPVVKDGYLIGRGAQDNKGPAVAMLYVMRCIRELGLPAAHELCLFAGCDEERGMSDLEYYTSKYPLPALSMIADCGFPVCYGEKGILEGAAVSGRDFSDEVLELYIHLADVLSVKAGMGNRLCAAYAAGDKAALKEIAEKEIPSCMEKIKEYKRCREEIWDSESKIFGYEVLDIRLGGLLSRMETAQRRLKNYLTGRLDKLPELEEARLPYRPVKDGEEHKLCSCNSWRMIVSASPV